MEDRVVEAIRPGWRVNMSHGDNEPLASTRREFGQRLCVAVAQGKESVSP